MNSWWKKYRNGEWWSLAEQGEAEGIHKEDNLPLEGKGKRVAQEALTIRPPLPEHRSQFLTYTSDGFWGFVFIWQQYVT